MIKTTSATLLVAMLGTLTFSQVQAQGAEPNTPPAADAPRSSLSPKANTPAANSGGASLPGTIGAYTATQRGSAPPPANAGALNPNNGGKTITLNPGVPN